MKTYRPGSFKDPSLQREFSAIEQAAQRADPFAELVVQHAAPSRLRPGMFVYADGSDWNPGSGEGLYRRDKTNASWIFVG